MGVMDWDEGVAVRLTKLLWTSWDVSPRPCKAAAPKDPAFLFVKLLRGTIRICFSVSIAENSRGQERGSDPACGAFLACDGE